MMTKWVLVFIFTTQVWSPWDEPKVTKQWGYDTPAECENDGPDVSINELIRLERHQQLTLQVTYQCVPVEQRAR